MRYDYEMITTFMEKYRSQGFAEIDRNDPWIVSLEKNLAQRQQFFYIADLLPMKVLYVTAGSDTILGVSPSDFNLSSIFSRVHPEDFHKHNLARSMVIRKGYELLMKKNGISIHSAYSRVKGPTGNFFNLLFQVYSFYDRTRETVFVLVLLTDLSTFKMDRQNTHYYLGDDLTMFRYPDDDLFKVGHDFSDRELEIIKLIASGMGTEQIADKLFLSAHTVNTHRRNILKKTNMSTTRDLVTELQERGLL